MEDKLHPVVELLLARMKSHPGEFEQGETRWLYSLTDINEFGNDADKTAIHSALRDIRLAKTHEDVMDELCNGDERRRKQREDMEYERNLMQQAGSFGKPLTAARHPTIDDMKNNGILNAIRNIL